MEQVQNMTFEEFIQKAEGVLTIYTDGACRNNPGDGGWGVYMRDEKGVVYEMSGGETDTTNNRMEMMAVIKALELIPEGREVHIYTDSQYLKNGITSWIKQWKKSNWQTANRQPVKNQDLWEWMDRLSSKVIARWHWVRGHDGHFENERVDALAKTAIVRLRLTGGHA